MGYPLPLPERVSLLRNAVLGQVAGAVQQLDEYLHRWALRIQREAVPRYNFVGSVGQPIASRITARRWDAILYDPTAAAFTIDIPSPSYATIGDEILLIRTSASGAVVTLQAQGSVLDGETSLELATPREVVRLVDCGATWKRDPGAVVGGVPTGAVMPWAGVDPHTIPSGWLECTGQAVSRTTYAALFAIAVDGSLVVQAPFGVGDGSTTFNVPDYRGRVVLGTGTGTGLTARAHGATGGTETHALSAAEAPVNATTSSAANGVNIPNVWSGTKTPSAHANMQPWSAAKWMIKT